MKNKPPITFLLILASWCAAAQKANYFSLESGAYFGKANSNIANSMRVSGLGDKYESGAGWLDVLLGLGGVDGQYPRDRTGKLKYRVRAGHTFTPQTTVEAGFGLSYYGSVDGYDKMPTGTQVNRLWIQSWINTLYIAYFKSNEAGTAGIGAGPAFSLYKLTSIANSGTEQTNNQVLPGGMMTGFWNFYSTKLLYAGVRTELSFTKAATIGEIKVVNQSDPNFISTFRSTKTGSFTGSLAIQIGLKF